ncbi:hypothetical protein PSAC2689_110126 [Paraburkholderia sacchari]
MPVRRQRDHGPVTVRRSSRSDARLKREPIPARADYLHAHRASYTRIYADVDSRVILEHGFAPRNVRADRCARAGPACEYAQGEEDDGGIPFDHFVVHRGAAAAGVGRGPRFDQLAEVVEERRSGARVAGR